MVHVNRFRKIVNHDHVLKTLKLSATHDRVPILKAISKYEKKRTVYKKNVIIDQIKTVPIVITITIIRIGRNDHPLNPHKRIGEGVATGGILGDVVIHVGVVQVENVVYPDGNLII